MVERGITLEEDGKRNSLVIEPLLPVLLAVKSGKMCEPAVCGRRVGVAAFDCPVDGSKRE